MFSVTEAPIRVRRVSLGVTQTVDFTTYLKDVLSIEWGTTWASESLIAGEMACNYGCLKFEAVIFAL